MVEIYCDGADLEQIDRYASDPRISGFTTNPSIMKKAGIKRYRDFAAEVLKLVKGKPVSFEVLSDDFTEMEKQANTIARWADNVWVKIPITNTSGISTIGVINNCKSLNLNITAITSQHQIRAINQYLREGHIVSVFVGRVMDTGHPPPVCYSQAHLLWASPREVYNVVQAEELGYDIITLTPELIAKLALKDKDLAEYSLETVKQFYEDGKGIEL